jgi:signal transduction histidine kinase
MVRGIDEIVWAVNPKNDTIDQLVIYVCNFAEQFFRNSPTRCRIDVEQEIPVMALDSHVRHHLYLIAKESLHNVAKHANADRVWIRISCVDGYFVLVVEDRGVGFLPQEKDSGDGLNNMRERARKTGADLEIRSTPGEGTCVTLRYPLNQNS